MREYRVLFFDVDGTVLDFDAAESAAMRALFKKFGFGELSDELLAAYKAINVRYWQILERGEMTKKEILTARFREFFPAAGVDPDMAETFNAEYQYALGDTTVFHDDAMNVLLTLKKKHRVIAVTNGTITAQNKKLRASGLDKVFEAVYISELVGFEKPDRRFFEHAMASSGIADAGEILMIGDSLTSDIRGGVNAGIDTCWYNPGGKENTSGLRPDYEIRDLRELLALL